MDFLYEYGLFLAKTITFVLAFIAIIVAIASSAIKPKTKKGELVIDDISHHFEEITESLQHQLLTKDELKQHVKDQKKEAKRKKSDKEATETKLGRLFVLDFKGSIDAKEVEALREEITAVLLIATTEDEVLVRLESGGGMVHAYGLASSQLDRIRQRKIPLTIAVDKVAASGGYMMACVADHIISAPFAIVGSIGVIAQIPNFNKILKKHDIEYEQLTAGEYKRTLTIFGENTEKARTKFKQELEETHELFKEFINEHRPSLDIAKVATGEHWFGTKAKELGLIDKVQTSDDYIQQANAAKKIVHIKYEVKKSLSDKFAFSISSAIENTALKLWQNNRIYPGQ